MRKEREREWVRERERVGERYEQFVKVELIYTEYDHVHRTFLFLSA